MISTPKSARVTILLMSTALTIIDEDKIANSATANDIIPNVELNTNINGCADLRILSSSVRGKNVSMQVKITDTTRSAPRTDYPCVCNDASAYYFMVYPLDQAVQSEGVMMAKIKPFTKNLGVTRHQMTLREEYTETTEFPFVKNKNSKPFAHYYIAFACRASS